MRGVWGLRNDDGLFVKPTIIAVDVSSDSKISVGMTRRFQWSDTRISVGDIDLQCCVALHRCDT